MINRILISFVLLAITSLSANAAPIAVNSICYLTDMQAVMAWQNLLPAANNTGGSFSYLLGTITASTSGGNLTIPYTSQVDGQGAISTHTAILSPCMSGVIPDSPRTTKTQDILILGLSVLCFFIGFNFGRGFSNPRIGTTS